MTFNLDFGLWNVFGGHVCGLWQVRWRNLNVNDLSFFCLFVLFFKLFHMCVMHRPYNKITLDYFYHVLMANAEL